MKINLEGKEMVLKYLTDKFTLEGTVKKSKHDDEANEWKDYDEDVAALTQIEVEFHLTERAVLPNQPCSSAKPVWYSSNIAYYDDLNADGNYRFPRAHPDHFFAFPTGRKPDEETLEEATKRQFKEAFPNHNIGSMIKIHSSLKTPIYPCDDIVALVNPYVRALMQHLIEEGQKLVGYGTGLRLNREATLWA